MIQWKGLQQESQSIETVESLFANHNGNIAFIAGSASENLVCLDIEEKGLFKEFSDEFKAKHGDTWMIKSRRGGHILFRTPQPVLTRSYKPNGYEVLGQGHYHLAPPSRFIDAGGKPFDYEFLSKPDRIAYVEHQSFFPLEFVQLQDSPILQPVERAIDARMDLESCLVEIDRLYRKRTEEMKSDLSRFDMSVIQTLVNKGTKKDTIREALAQTSVETHYSKLYRAQGEWRANQNFDFSYKKAASAGDTKEYRENGELAEKMVVIVQATAWSGRTGGNDRDAMLAHIKKFNLCRKRGWNISSREGSELGDMSHISFENRTNDLIKRRYLKRVDSGSRVLLKSPRYDFGDVWIEMLQSFTYNHNTTNVGICNDKQLREPETYGVFERGKGLGKSAKSVWMVLQKESLTRKQIAEKTGLHRSTISRSLKELDEYSLVEEINGTTYASPNYDFKKLADSLGTAQIAINRKRQHEADRQRQKELLFRENKRSKEPVHPPDTEGE